MKYNPENPLTEEELDKLGNEDFDSFLEYLDGITEFKKRKGNPLVKEAKKKKHDMLKSTGVKNVKTHRSQWFD